jgi:hypothetical protein
VNPAEAYLDERDSVGPLLRQQFKALLTRHTLEDVVLVRVLIEHYNQVALAAKRGDLMRARRDYEALSVKVPLPPAKEIAVILDSFALPVSALIYWQQGEYSFARCDLVNALKACADLVVSYGHTFVTGRQLHLANNYLRVLLSEGRTEEATGLFKSLQLVSNGDQSQWPFVGADTLTIPLVGDWRKAIDAQLRKIEGQILEMSH